MKFFQPKNLVLGLSSLAALRGMKAHAAPIGTPVAKAAPQTTGDVLEARNPQNWNTLPWSTLVNWSTVNYGAPVATVAPAPVAPTVAPAPAPAKPTAAPVAPAPVAPPAAPVGGGNSLTVNNRGNKGFPVALFEDLAPEQPSFEPSTVVSLAMGQSTTLPIPNGWSGRAQKLLAGAGDPATWGELTYNGAYNQVWGDVSYLRGHNGAMTMTTSDGSFGVAGTSENLLAEGSTLQTQDPAGNTVLPPTEPYTGGVNQPLVDFYRAHNSGGGYVRNTDNYQVHTSADQNVVIDIW